MSESAGAGTSVSAPTPSSSAPQAQPQSPVPAPAYPERVRVKIEGREVEVPFDQVLQDYQMKEASNRRFQQASEMHKKAGPILAALEKGDLRSLMSSVPKDQFRQFAEEFLIGEMEYEGLPDYEKRRIQAEMRAQSLEEELKGERESKTKEKSQRDLFEAGAAVDKEIGDVLRKMGKEPTPYLIGAIVDEMLASLDGKGQPLSAEKAFQKAKARLDGSTEAYFGDMSDADFIQRLPPQRIEAVRKHILSQVKTQQNRPQAQAQTQAPMQRSDAKPMSIDEAFAAREAQIKSQRRKA
jgi:hypothetical protein